MVLEHKGLDVETLDMVLNSLKEFAAHALPDEKLRALDRDDLCPAEILRELGGDGLGIQQLFVPEAYGGMGGSAFDVYRVCEAMGHVDVGIATGVLATFLGSDPIVFGGTEEQKAHWLGRIAAEGLVFAYGATEPAAGSDLGALRSTAERILQDGAVVGYRLNGDKQWISNGGIADVYTFLAKAPDGPTWFIVERDAEGLSHGKPEDKFGIRLSNTTTVHCDGVVVGPDRVVGLAEGQGLRQAQLVFGYTRLMVAAFGLGAGWSALDRAIPYSVDRVQAGAPLAEKQGFTHKLIVPHVVSLEAGRAVIEETAERIDLGEGNLNTEGAVAKLLSTEAGWAAADAAMQALGGYGYTKEYMVEKAARDVRITRIYEGTSEIMEMTVARDRWQLHLKTRGAHYHDWAGRLEVLARARPEVGAATAALALHALSAVLEQCRVHRLTRQQHVLFRIGELVTYGEGAATLARRAARAADGKLDGRTDRRFDAASLAIISRIFARGAAQRVAEGGVRIVIGGGGAEALGDLEQGAQLSAIRAAQAGLYADMDRLADVIYQRV